MNYTKTLLDFAAELNVTDLGFRRSTVENLTAWVARGSYTHDEAAELVEDIKRDIRKLAAEREAAREERWADTLRSCVEALRGCDRHTSAL